MRSLTAIICLTAFFALQYGKLVSYWHCRIASIYTSTPCDCVQQLLDTHKDTTHHSAVILKEKTEEVVLFHEQHTTWQPTETAASYERAYITFIPETHSPAIFQPPRL
ncbi:hypothetical protein A4D02_11750 [Niastella koreensis]|uniref:Uncharacterized protein n=1 Tax=Niastella koreensis TaxID=354356 RepID=A0ABX3NQU1_9BACT|nr:hypothetical protein [Niastella koreensis]OQP42257.1 hypothetical protein A4D02_11750 [Niastella koreensis]